MTEQRLRFKDFPRGELESIAQAAQRSWDYISDDIPETPEFKMYDQIEVQVDCVADRIYQHLDEYTYNRFSKMSVRDQLALIKAALTGKYKTFLDGVLKLTYSDAKRRLQLVGIVLTHPNNGFTFKISRNDKPKPTIYYTNDLEEALRVGNQMVQTTK